MKFRLLFFLFIVSLSWAVVASEYHTVSNPWIESSNSIPVVCARDGFNLNNNGTCQCDTDYSGPVCLNRKCRNYGLNALEAYNVDKCFCPPSLLGANCEPVKCRKNKNIFQTSDNQKSISLIATYNFLMEDSWGSDYDLTKLVCNYTNFARHITLYQTPFKLFPATTPAEDCSDIINQLKNVAIDECGTSSTEPNEYDAQCALFDVNILLKRVQQSPPNSIIFVVTNVKTLSTDDKIAQQIISIAIARQIQIHVHVYSNIRQKNTPSDPGFSYLRNIAVSTLGNFVVNSVRNNSNHYSIVQQFLENWKNGVTVSAAMVYPNTLFKSSSSFYITAEVELGEDLTINNNRINAILEADYWKLYKIENVNLVSLAVTGQKNGTIPFVYSSDSIKSYSAFTTDQSVEASFPIGIVGIQYSLVARFEYNNSILPFENFNSSNLIVSDKNILTISNNTIIERPKCSLNAQFSIQCNSPGTSLIQFITKDRRSAVFPVYCSSIKNVVNNIDEDSLYEDHFYVPSQLDDNTCGTDIPVENFKERSFFLVVQNTRDSNLNLSSIYNMFIGPNSIFYPLSAYVKSTNVHYSNYNSVLYNSAGSSFVTENDYGKFLTLIMQTINSSEPHQNETNPIDILSLINNSLKNISQFSDILIVINSNISSIDNDSDELMKVYEQIDRKRAKIYILIVQTYVQFSDRDFIVVKNLATRSGGVATRFGNYDSLKNFFDVYFESFVSSDVVAQVKINNPVARGFSLANLNLENETYSLLISGSNFPSENVTVRLNGSPVAINQIQIHQDLQIVTFQPSPALNATVTVLFPNSKIMTKKTAVLLENTNSKNFINLAFLDKTNSLTNIVKYNEGQYIPYIYFSNSQQLISSQISIGLNSFDDIYSGSVTNSSSVCLFDKFKFSANFQWVCSSKNDFYYVKIDAFSVNNSLTRTFTQTCLSNPSTNECLNGGSFINKCQCASQWTGNVCQVPICQNNGSVTPQNKCVCDANFEGDFCEKSKIECSSKAAEPDFRTYLSSIIFVADTRYLESVNLTKGAEFPGIPLTVIQYGEVDPQIVLTTTNGYLLPTVLRKTESVATSSNSSLYSALRLAFNSQITKRALIIVLTTDPNELFDSDIRSDFASHRVELRLVTNSALISSDALVLALLGNGVPAFIDKSDDFQKYFDGYILELFNGKNKENVFNVHSTNFISNQTVVKIPDSQPDFPFFIHVINGTINNGELIIKNSIYNLYSFQNITGSLTIFKNTSSDGYAKYSIETINRLKTSYVFNELPTEESKLYVAPVVNRQNVISIYSVPFDSNFFNLHSSINVREILKNGDLSLQNNENVLLTLKSNSCFYQYYSILPECNSSTIGYQIQLINHYSINTSARQQQFVVTCHQSERKDGSTNCGPNGVSNSNSNTCQCNQGWKGIDCSEPICENGGVAIGSVCKCLISFYGSRCENKKQGSGSTRVAAFIVDLIGADDGAFNRSLEAIQLYHNSVNNSAYVALANNADNETISFQQIDSLTLESILNNLFIKRKSNANANLTNALNLVLNSYKNLTSLPGFSTVLSSNIFYITQTELNNNDNPSDILKELDEFKTSTVVLTKKFAPPPSNDFLTSFSSFSQSRVSNVTDAYNAALSLYQETDFNSLLEKPQNLNRKCVYYIQSNVLFAIDKSKTSNDVENTLFKFLQQFRSGFNYIENDENRCTQDLPSFYNERSAMGSFVVYDRYGVSSSYCPSSFELYLNYTVTADKTVPDWTERQQKVVVRNINSECNCNRLNDEKTSKFVIWLPRATVSNTSFASNFKINTNTTARHFVVPFYDLPSKKDGDLYYNILETNRNKSEVANSLLPNIMKNPLDSIINSLYDEICSTAGVPSIEKDDEFRGKDNFGIENQQV